MKKVLLGVMAAAFLYSCSNSDDDTNNNGGIDENLKHGYFVVNEGNFGSSNSTISYISPNLSNLQTDVFGKKNNGAIQGDTTQSVTFDGDKAYIVMNNSNLIHIVDRYSFKKIGEITEGLVLPRYAAVANGKIYVTNSGDMLVNGDEFISVHDLETFSLIKRIELDIVAEEIFANDNYLYVSSNPWAVEHKIGVFDLSNDDLINTINLDNQITGIVKNSGDGIFVLESDSDKSTISKIEGTDFVENVITTSARNAQHLVLYNGYLYTVANQNQVFRINATLPNFPSSPSFSIGEQSPYGFNILNGNVFVANTNFMEESSIIVYNLQGDFVKWFQGGMGTSKFYKN